MFLSSLELFFQVNATPISAMQPMMVTKERMADQLVMEFGGKEHAKVSQYFGLQIFKISFMIMLVSVDMAVFGCLHIRVTPNTAGKRFRWIL